MPGYLLHQGATVFCAHVPGQAQPTVPNPNPRVKVSGQQTVQQPNPWTISACSFSTAVGPQPCVTAQWRSAAKRLKSGGQPLLLHDSEAICAPNGTGVNIVTTQTRVKGT